MSEAMMDGVIAEIMQADSVVICSHEKPDGDALGSSLALAWILRGLGKQVGLVGYMPISARYAFLAKTLELETLPQNPQLFIALDCGDLTRLEPSALKLVDELPVLNIDHHVSNTGFGRTNWVDAKASSVGEMIFRLAVHAGWTIPPEAATPIWVAISTDTGDFRYSNTTPQVMRIAAELLEMGVQPHLVKRELNDSQTIEDLNLQRRILEKLTVESDGKLGYIHLSEKDFAELNCGPANMHDPVNTALSIKGVCVAACIYEVPGENRVKMSLRSYEPLDASEFCKRFGGGGHPRAAGCSFKGESLDAVLGKLLPALRQFVSNK